MLLKLFREQAKMLKNAYLKAARENKTENGIGKGQAKKMAKEIVENITIWDSIENATLLELFNTYLKAGNQGNSLSIAISGEDILFNAIRRQYITWVNTQGARQIKRVTETTRDIVRRVVENGLIDGISTSNIATEIENRLIEIGKSRAVTIARTETHNAMMFAREINFNKAGFQYWRWITSRDERVRGNKPTDTANHVQNDNVIRKIGDKFPSGITRPGDPQGDPANIIRCRCEIIPATEQEYRSQQGKS